MNNWQGGEGRGSVYIKMLKIHWRYDDNFLATGWCKQIDLCIHICRYVWTDGQMGTGGVAQALLSPGRRTLPTFSHVSLEL